MPKYIKWHESFCSNWVPSTPPSIVASGCTGCVPSCRLEQTASVTVDAANDVCLCSNVFGACRDAQAAGMAQYIKWHDGPCSKWVPRTPPSTVVVNPPWGRRLLNDADEEDEAEGQRWSAGGLHSILNDQVTCCCQCVVLLNRKLTQKASMQMNEQSCMHTPSCTLTRLLEGLQSETLQTKHQQWQL